MIARALPPYPLPSPVDRSGAVDAVALAAADPRSERIARIKADRERLAQPARSIARS